LSEKSLKLLKMKSRIISDIEMRRVIPNKQNNECSIINTAKTIPLNHTLKCCHKFLRC